MISMLLMSQPGKQTWILVANGTQANVYHTDHIDRFGSGESALTLTAVEGMAMKAEALERFDLGRHEPARVIQSATNTPSMTGDPRESAMDHIRGDFASAIAQRLNEAGEKGRFANLVVVTSPAMLGAIKGHLSKRVTQCLKADHAADLTHFSGSELLTRLSHLFQPEAA